MTHAHITTWLIALILFFITLQLHKNGKLYGSKIAQGLLRLVYLLIIITGAMMLLSINITGLYIAKMILGIFVIGFIEMILIQTMKRKANSLFWGLFVVSFAGVIYLGLELPMGF